MIAYETRLGKIDITEAYLSKLIGHEVTSCFGVVGMIPSDSRQKVWGMLFKGKKSRYRNTRYRKRRRNIG